LILDCFARLAERKDGFGPFIISGSPTKVEEDPIVSLGIKPGVQEDERRFIFD
jgi:hypothetical protein